MIKPSISAIRLLFERKGYQFFEQGDYNLNLVGIRSPERTANKFDDTLAVIYNVGGRETIQYFQITTDPGLIELQKPSFAAAQKEGTAILVEGQYRGAFRLGFHGQGAWRHRALIQAKPLRVYRDSNRDGVLDMDASKITEGLYGINIHASSLYVHQQAVQNWSAGCQVFANPVEYREFIGLVEKAALIYGETFTYTLVNGRELAS